MKGLRAVSCLALCLMWTAACQRQPSPTVFIDPALAVLVPADTRLLAGVRLQNLLKTPEAAAQAAGSPRLLQFRKSMGLPQEADIWEILIASNGSGWVALMRGKFTEMGMEPRLDKPGATRMSHEGVPVLGDEKGAVAFLNPTTAIAGSVSDVVRVLRQRNETMGIPTELAKLTGRIPSKYDVWFAATGTAPDFVSAEGVRFASGGANLATRRYDLHVDAERGNTDIKDERLPEELLAWILRKAEK